jgi:hypothetical protein
MSRSRRIALALLCVLLIGGLLLAGPGHALAHADDHGGPCDACKLAPTQAPLAFHVHGAVAAHEVRAVERSEAPRTHHAPVSGRPRAPPQRS